MIPETGLNLGESLRQCAHLRPVGLAGTVDHHAHDSLGRSGSGQELRLAAKAFVLQMVMGIVEAHTFQLRSFLLAGKP